VRYASRDGTNVVGRVCRPADQAPHSLLLLAHGGFTGIGSDGGLCTKLAARGHVVIEPSYRGEDSSSGAVELCLGEVDDALEMLVIATRQPYVDPARVGIQGSSHGGCVVLRALERGIAVRAASEAFGPTDLAVERQFLNDELVAGPTASDAQVLRGLRDRIEAVTGGAPHERAGAYAQRSPLGFAAQLGDVPMMIVHGADDRMVAVGESCAFAAAIGRVHAYHLDRDGGVLADPPPGCAPEALTWLTGPLPTTWPDNRYLVVFDGAGHEFASPRGQVMAQTVLSFVIGRLEAKR
jgi:dipeptidyl aminopeptidase/acylaminoacyl peptidase